MKLEYDGLEVGDSFNCAVFGKGEVVKARWLTKQQQWEVTVKFPKYEIAYLVEVELNFIAVGRRKLGELGADKCQHGNDFGECVYCEDRYREKGE